MQWWLLNPTIYEICITATLRTSCGIEQCAEDKCFYERETHRPFPPRQMSSRQSHVCANASIGMCLCVNRTLIWHSGKQMCVSGRVSQQTNITSYLSVRMETGKQQSSQTQTHVHTLAPVLSGSGKLELCLLHSH